MSGLTIDDPIRFEYAISSDRIIPGDTLLLRGGTYAGDWTLNIGGIKDAPVAIRPYPGEAVTIDGGLRCARPYVHIYDLEVTDTSPDDGTDHNNVIIDPVGCRLIGCHIHHVKGNGVKWFSSGEGGVVECWIHDNGYRDAVGTGYAHGIYTHNHAGGARLIARNLFGNQVGRYAIQVYSAGENYLRDYTVEDNVINGDPVICGGGLGLTNYLCQRNIQFQDYWFQGRYSMQPNDGGVIRDNLFIKLADYSVQSTFQNLVEENNTVWQIDGIGQPSNRAGYTVEPTPASWSQFIPFTLSERWAGIQCTLTDGVFSAAMVGL